MRVVTAQLQLSTRTGPQSHATTVATAFAFALTCHRIELLTLEELKSLQSFHWLLAHSPEKSPLLCHSVNLSLHRQSKASTQTSRREQSPLTPASLSTPRWYRSNQAQKPSPINSMASRGDVAFGSCCELESPPDPATDPDQTSPLITTEHQTPTTKALRILYQTWTRIRFAMSSWEVYRRKMECDGVFEIAHRYEFQWCVAS